MRNGAATIGLLALLFALPALADCPPLRSQTQKTAFKRVTPCPGTHKISLKCPGYVIDHVIPLACGGPDLVSNMQWQTVAEGKAKDKWERVGCHSGHR